jgi:hypothetical protein
MKFKVGDKVYKPKGYKFPGIVVAVFQTTSGDFKQHQVTQELLLN